jgi:hypothetical protein
LTHDYRILITLLLWKTPTPSLVNTTSAPDSRARDCTVSAATLHFAPHHMQVVLHQSGAASASAHCRNAALRSTLVQPGRWQQRCAKKMQHFSRNQQNDLYQCVFENSIYSLRYLLSNQSWRQPAGARRAFVGGHDQSKRLQKYKDNP